jgi:hypothetical protein
MVLRPAHLFALLGPLAMASACQVLSGLNGYQIGNGGGATTGGSSSGVSSSGASSSGASSSGASSSGTSSSGVSSSGSSGSGPVSWCDASACAVGGTYDFVSALAADDAGVYWTAIPNGGPPEQIYWAKTGSSVASSALLPNGDSFRGLATDESGTLYFTASGTVSGTDPARLYALTLADGGSAQVSTTTFTDAGAVAVVSASGRDVAWATQSGSLGLEVTTTNDTAVPISGPPASLLLAGGVSRHVFFAANADLYHLGSGTTATLVGSLGVVPTFIAPDTNLSNGYLYFVSNDVRRILKNSLDGGVEGWVTPAIPTTMVTVTGFVATDAPFWIEQNKSSHLGQIFTSQTTGAGTRDPVGPQITWYPQLLAAGGGYLYYAFQDTTQLRWHIGAVPIPSGQ